MSQEDFKFVLQARNGSTRLPEKVTTVFQDGNSILEIILSRLKTAFPLIPIVVATTPSERDKSILEQSAALGIQTYTGPEHDVLGRMVKSVAGSEPKCLIRVCCDNPYLDMELLEYQLRMVLLNGGFDYYSYYINENLPSIKSHLGVFAEVVRFDALKKIDQLDLDPFYKEHVTNYLYESGKFRIMKLALPQYLLDFTSYRLTVDDQIDYNYAQDLWGDYKSHDLDLSKLLPVIDSSESRVELMKLQISKYTK